MSTTQPGTFVLTNPPEPCPVCGNNVERLEECLILMHQSQVLARLCLPCFARGILWAAQQSLPPPVPDSEDDKQSAARRKWRRFRKNQESDAQEREDLDHREQDLWEAMQREVAHLEATAGVQAKNPADLKRLIEQAWKRLESIDRMQVALAAQTGTTLKRESTQEEP